MVEILSIQRNKPQHGAVRVTIKDESDHQKIQKNDMERNMVTAPPQGIGEQQ